MTTNANKYNEHGREQLLAAYIELNDYPPCKCWIPGHDETHGGSMFWSEITPNMLPIDLNMLRPSTIREMHEDICSEMQIEECPFNCKLKDYYFKLTA
ncbi:hypothetical protein LCGC14_2364000 [marine sediment metagenome]|uniref:Uncharacterized protein n=1 Tax=marine sediment metagenome TaxID=412755 RepID=A0A0F9F0I0_9ZZZZ